MPLTIEEREPLTGADRERTEGVRVLVVDDEPTVRRMAARILREVGYEVHEADNGADALDLIVAGVPAVHCVVSDVVMPRLNGVELLEALSRCRPDLPVLLMSAYGAAQLSERGIAAPCAMLAKPFDPDLLASEVRRCLEQTATGGA